ncbi:FAD-binding protein [Dethiosulfatarculus sandiegensis]|uniref:Oxidoreductase n=1 Tax=Dethiosulfatarculus sandiegensis TaxID=1429043 RepID=A0A0D2HKJ7_9BACT|nr:FAD-binding protein [Dethiosulfatarculus sandiegensis]KIX11173.1 oxidoreductase [Dethiosulfatarculus sandiegensis]
MGNQYLEADLLIIGGGSAGCMAAIRALELDPELKVVIFEKGDIDYSGSIARGMDALNIVSIPNLTSPELYVESVTEGSAGVADAPASHLMAARSFDLLKKLEGWGVYFPLDASGNYRTLKYHVKGNFQTAMQEPDLKTMMSGMTKEKGAFAVNRVMGVKLLQDGPKVSGAVGLNVRTGEMVVAKAKAVIVCAGGQARFSLPNSGYLYGGFDFPGNTGDGYVMAYRAGASLTGMEATQSPVVIKDANMPLLAVTVTRGGKVLDMLNNVIMQNEVNHISRMNEVHEKGLGPVRIRLSHLDEAVIQEIEGILFTTERPVQERFFKNRKIDFRRDDIELWPTECQLCGGHGISGVRVNEKAECQVPGLFVAGDVASVPKQHLSGALVFGEVAAESAVEFMKENKKAEYDPAQVQEAIGLRNQRAEAKTRELDVRELEFKVRRFIGDYLIGLKNKDKLEKWLHWSEIFRDQLAKQTRAANPHELSKLYEVEHIIQCADFSAVASLTRTESRWGSSHRRADYPEQDDKNWKCHVVLQKDEDPSRIKALKAPVIGM